MDRLIDAKKIIDALGGTGVLAKFVGVSPAAVSQWRKYGIPDMTFRWLKERKKTAFARMEK